MTEYLSKPDKDLDPEQLEIKNALKKKLAEWNSMLKTADEKEV